MAKPKTNKSQLVREYANKNPNATPKDIILAMASKGQEVSRPLIVQALKNTPNAIVTKKRRKRRGKKTKVASPKSTVKTAGKKPASTKSAQFAQLLLAAEFSRSMGGIDAAFESLNALKEVANKL